MVRVLGVAALALTAGFGLGIGSGAFASTDAKTVTQTKTPVPCLLALESAWKVIYGTPSTAESADQRSQFDTGYAACLQAG